MLALSWAAVAYAQASADAQYGSPTATASGSSARSIGGGGALGGSEASGASISAKILPLTGGGPVLPLVALSTLVLSSIVPLAAAVPKVRKLLTDWQHEKLRS